MSKYQQFLDLNQISLDSGAISNINDDDDSQSVIDEPIGPSGIDIKIPCP